MRGIRRWGTPFVTAAMLVTASGFAPQTSEAAELPTGVVERTWRAVNGGPSGYGTLAYDALRKETVLLLPGAPTQTWVFDGATHQWHQRFPATSPTLHSARIAFDVARGNVVAIGTNANGSDCTDSAPGETWLWSGTDWQQAHPPDAPGECGILGSSGMTYDAARHDVLLVTSNAESETWLWDGATWTNTGSAPSQASVAYDPSSRRVLAFGGVFFWHGYNFYGHTEAWNGTRWTKVSDSEGPRDPAPRTASSLVYDPMVGGVVLFGGQAGQPSREHRLSDTWRWVGNHWVRMGTINSPPPTAYASFAYDTEHQVGILYRGNSVHGAKTWLFGAAHAGGGYFVGEANGRVIAFGNARRAGDAHRLHLSQPVVGLARTVTRKGYWLAAADGGVFAYGDALYYGGTAGRHLDAPIVAIAATPSGNGYWLAARDGSVFPFGDARYAGSMRGKHLSQPIVGFASTPTGDGYWLAARDGGVFCFGDARFYGSAIGTRLRGPVTGIAATPRGNGYWLVTTLGNVGPFGHALFWGERRATSHMVAIASSPTGDGYTTFDARGGVHTFGDATRHGRIPASPPHAPVVGAAVT